MKEKIIEIIRDSCAVEENNIMPETKLQDISLDSLSFIECLVRIEEMFNIEFEVEELDTNGWENVGDILKEAERKIHENRRD